MCVENRFMSKDICKKRTLSCWLSRREKGFRIKMCGAWNTSQTEFITTLWDEHVTSCGCQHILFVVERYLFSAIKLSARHRWLGPWLRIAPHLKIVSIRKKSTLCEFFQLKFYKFSLNSFENRKLLVTISKHYLKKKHIIYDIHLCFF